MRQASDVAEQAVEDSAMRGRDEFSTSSAFTLGIKFPVRSERDFEMMHLARGSMTIPLCDVRQHRNRRFAHLIRQTEPPFTNPFTNP